MSTTFAGETTATVSTSGYPVSVTIARQESYSKFFAIPVLGYIVRTLLLIPHMIALIIVAAVTILMHLVAWIPVLMSGSYPGWAYTWSSGMIRYSTRFFAYYFGLTDKYPPFSLGSNDDGYPVQVVVQRPTNPGKFWAIPVIGLLAREIALIPHLIILYILNILVNVFQLVTWAPVLFGGQYPTWGEAIVGGYIRWTARVSAYIFGLSDRYPPFALDN